MDDKPDNRNPPRVVNHSKTSGVQLWLQRLVYVLPSTVLLWISWCIECLASGVFPDARHDGTPFVGLHDEIRSSMAGKMMKFKVAVLKLKGD